MKLTIIRGNFNDPMPVSAFSTCASEPAPGHYSVFVDSKEDAEKLAALFPKYCGVKASRCSGFSRDRQYGLSVHFDSPEDQFGVAYCVSFRFSWTVTSYGKESRVTGGSNESAVKRAKTIAKILLAYEAAHP